MTVRRSVRAAAGAALMIAAVVAAAPAARADDLAMDISSHQISITSSFTGAEILVFGAVRADDDVPRDLVVVLRGPGQKVTVRRKAPVAGMWLNRDSRTFGDVPGYYAVASTRPLADVADPAVLSLHQIGLEALHLDDELPHGGLADPELGDWRNALMRLRVADGLYASGVPIGRIGAELFRTEFRLPSNVPVGNYRAEVYVLAAGRVLSAQVSPLFIDKSGLDRAINVAATRYAPLYGLLAVLLSVLAGWLADAIFRRA